MVEIAIEIDQDSCSRLLLTSLIICRKRTGDISRFRNLVRQVVGQISRAAKQALARTTTRSLATT